MIAEWLQSIPPLAVYLTVLGVVGIESFGIPLPGEIVLVDVEGWTPETDDNGVTKPAPESATFTFRGEAKPTPVPDTPEVAAAE